MYIEYLSVNIPERTYHYSGNSLPIISEILYI